MNQDKNTSSKAVSILALSLLFIGTPLLIYYGSNFTQRNTLMEFVSLLTIMGMFAMLCQFFLTRMGNLFFKGFKLTQLVKLHKILGFVSISIFFAHPVLIVLPKYFDDGISPIDALITMVTQFDNKGILFGLIAWVLMLLIGLTAVFRKQMRLRHAHWRKLHGSLCVVFILTATLHALAIGRHMNTTMSVSLILLATTAILITLNSHWATTKPHKKQQKNPVQI